MDKQQAKNILLSFIGEISLKRSDYITLETAIFTLFNEGVKPPLTRPPKETDKIDLTQSSKEKVG